MSALVLLLLRAPGKLRRTPPAMGSAARAKIRDRLFIMVLTLLSPINSAALIFSWWPAVRTGNIPTETFKLVFLITFTAQARVQGEAAGLGYPMRYMPCCGSSSPLSTVLLMGISVRDASRCCAFASTASKLIVEAEAAKRFIYCPLAFRGCALKAVQFEYLAPEFQPFRRPPQIGAALE